MSATFFIALLAALLAIVYWRVVLILVGALVIAMVVTGISSVSGAIANQEQPPTITAPARPGSSPDSAEAEQVEGTGGLESDPRVEEEPPR